MDQVKERSEVEKRENEYTEQEIMDAMCVSWGG